MKFCEISIGLISVCMLFGFVQSEQPYIVKNEGWEYFNGIFETTFHLGEMKIIGRQRYINGTIKFTEDMASDHFSFQIELYSCPQGEKNFKLLPMGVPRTPICEGLKELFPKVLQASFIEGENTNFPFVPDEGLCPIPMGEYYIKNLEFDTDSWPNHIIRGLLKAKLTFFKDAINVGGGALIMRVEDRE